MNPNLPNHAKKPLIHPELVPASDRELTAPLSREEELRGLAREIVKHCPSLTQLLLAVGADSKRNPLRGMN